PLARVRLLARRVGLAAPAAAERGAAGRGGSGRAERAAGHLAAAVRRYWPGVRIPARNRDHMIAMGLTGDPVPAGSLSGAITHMNDHRPACSHSATSSPNAR